VFRYVLGFVRLGVGSTLVAAWAWPTWVVSRRRVLEVVFILLEPPSPSRKIFIGSHSLPPLSFAVSVLQPYPPDELVQVLYTSRSPRKLIPWNTPGRKLADLLVNV
jgi:hypothetical protein